MTRLRDTHLQGMTPLPVRPGLPVMSPQEKSALFDQRSSLESGWLLHDVTRYRDKPLWLQLNRYIMDGEEHVTICPVTNGFTIKSEAGSGRKCF